MPKKITAILFSLCIVIFLSSSVWGFGSNANKLNPSNEKDTRLREYTPENAAKPLGQGGYYGGHDTIMGEAVLLKKDVHSSNNNFKKFVDQSLPNFRTGAHDEDSKKWKILGLDLGYIGTEPPIGPNGDGDYMYHFYDPDSGKGLGKNDSAVKRANDYSTLVNKKLCDKDFCDMSPDEQKEIIDYMGRIGHLIADMAVPEHV